MSNPRAPVLLSGEQAVLERLRPALAAAGFEVVAREAPPLRSSPRSPPLWIHAGPAASLPASFPGPGVVVAPELGDAELHLLGDGVVDVLLDAAPPREVVARLTAVGRRTDAGGARVESARAESLAELHRHEEFISHLTSGVAVVDAAGALQMLNPAGAAILDWSDPIARANLLDLARPVDAPSVQKINQAISQSAGTVDVDVTVQLHGGRRVVLAISAGRLQRAEGHAILSFRDVTAQRATEVELRKTRDFLEHLVDGSSDAIVASDMRGRLVVFNGAAERLFGIPAKEAQQRLSVIDLYPEGGAREIMRLLRDDPKGHIEAFRAYCRTVAGELVPIEISASLARMGGSEVATVGLMRDLRERVRVEGELARTRTRLIDAEKQAAIVALGGATAHELNQPLTVIFGYLDLLRRRMDEHQRRPLEAISAQASRMAEIVKRIGQLTHIETVAYPGERQIADLERSSEKRPGPPVVGR